MEIGRFLCIYEYFIIDYNEGTNPATIGILYSMTHQSEGEFIFSSGPIGKYRHNARIRCDNMRISVQYKSLRASQTTLQLSIDTVGAI